MQKPTWNVSNHKAELIKDPVHRMHGFAGVGGRGIKNKNK